MDNFDLAPVTVWALSAVKRVRLTLKWQLLARSPVQMLEEVISSPILYLINNFKEN